MENKLYIGTMMINDKIHLTFSNNESNLIKILLVSDAEHVDEDLDKLSSEMNKPVYRPF